MRNMIKHTITDECKCLLKSNDTSRDRLEVQSYFVVRRHNCTKVRQWETHRGQRRRGDEQNALYLVALLTRPENGPFNNTAGSTCMMLNGAITYSLRNSSDEMLVVQLHIPET